MPAHLRDIDRPHRPFQAVPEEEEEDANLPTSANTAAAADDAENGDRVSSAASAAANGHTGGRAGERPKLESAPAVLLEALGALPPYRWSPYIRTRQI